MYSTLTIWLSSSKVYGGPAAKFSKFMYSPRTIWLSSSEIYSDPAANFSKYNYPPLASSLYTVVQLPIF